MQNAMLQRLMTINNMKSITSTETLRDKGKDLRKTVPLADLGQLPTVSRDPVAFVDAIESKLIPELMPQRNAKMMANPAAFFRGTAELMAYDLSHEVQSGIKVLTDGDAHLQNFGFYASPERNLLFDLNDFDEAASNSFEYDIKRLVTSSYLLGAQHHFDEAAMDDLARRIARTYRKTLKHAFKHYGALERFYASTDVSQLLTSLPDPDDALFVQRIMDKAKNRDSESVIKKYTEQTRSGHLRFKESAPRSVHLDSGAEIELMKGLLQYQTTTRPDTSLLLAQYHITDIIRHSVGIGSFGTHCYLVLMTGLGGSHLVLQVKEALPRRRELAPNNLAITQALEADEGQRIIAAQQILQKASDPFLGWFSLNNKSFYVRQFRDMKESIDVSLLDWNQFEAYTRVCAYLLALAHAQSPTAAIASGYLDKEFDTAIQKWSKAYLHQVINDYAAFIAAHGQDKA